MRLLEKTGTQTLKTKTENGITSKGVRCFTDPDDNALISACQKSADPVFNSEHCTKTETLSITSGSETTDTADGRHVKTVGVEHPHLRDGPNT